MDYPNIVEGRFLARPNRFISKVELGGREETVHVKNTGRCRELLIPGAAVYMQDWGQEHPGRRTRYDLVTVDKGGLLINMDAQAPNRLFREWAEGGHFVPGLTLLRSEVTHGDSRFDFYWEAGDRRGFVEVKGVTLEEDGVVRFPDAPTLRGVKHLNGLLKAREEGYEAAVCFVVQLAGADHLEPNDRTHPEFGQALRRAAEGGVAVLAFSCRVTPDTVTPAEPVPVVLNGRAEGDLDTGDDLPLAERGKIG